MIILFLSSYQNNMLFIMEGIDLALLIQIFKGFKSTLPRPASQDLPIFAGWGKTCFFAGRGGPFSAGRGGAGHTSLLFTLPVYTRHVNEQHHIMITISIIFIELDAIDWSIFPIIKIRLKDSPLWKQAKIFQFAKKQGKYCFLPAMFWELVSVVWKGSNWTSLNFNAVWLLGRLVREL